MDTETQKVLASHKWATQVASRVFVRGQEMGLHITCWENSTRKTGTRTVRVKILAGDQRKVNRLMRFARRRAGKYFSCCKIYTHNNRWERLAFNRGKRITNNSFAIWYASDNKRHTAMFAK